MTKVFIYLILLLNYHWIQRIFKIEQSFVYFIEASLATYKLFLLK